MLTELGMAGADIFTIMKIAGHGSTTMEQRYVHAMQESLERAIDRMEEARTEMGNYATIDRVSLQKSQRNDVV